MKRTLTRKNAEELINIFFNSRAFDSKELKKIRRLAMKYKIPLKSHRKLFCKYCLNKLKGKVRISKTHKNVTCKICGKTSKFRLTSKT